MIVLVATFRLMTVIIAAIFTIIFVFEKNYSIHNNLQYKNHTLVYKVVLHYMIFLQKMTLMLSKQVIFNSINKVNEITNGIKSNSRADVTAI